MGCHSLSPQLAYKRIDNGTRISLRPNLKVLGATLFSSSLNHPKQLDACNVKLKTLAGCKLGISRYPDFDYNGTGGAGSGKTARILEATRVDSEIDLVSVDFDVEQLYIPPLSTATTKLLGVPLPPFLKIDIIPEVLRGTIDQDSGKVDLKLRAKFWFSVGSVYRAPALLVETVLTSEESKGKTRGGKGERLDKEGRCRLVGVATVEPVGDIFLDAFLGLPTECLATLNAMIAFSSTQ